MLVGCGLFSSLSDNPTISSAIYGYQVIFGLGIGMTFSTVIILVSLEADFKDYCKRKTFLNIILNGSSA